VNVTISDGLVDEERFELGDQVFELVETSGQRELFELLRDA
jgi:hypothetical protein